MELSRRSEEVTPTRVPIGALDEARKLAIKDTLAKWGNPYTQGVCTRTVCIFCFLKFSCCGVTPKIYSHHLSMNLATPKFGRKNRKTKQQNRAGALQ